ncbi:MAG: hypothetical protein WEA29_05030 [Acidimicrobiia bacterium]
MSERRGLRRHPEITRPGESGATAPALPVDGGYRHHRPGVQFLLDTVPRPGIAGRRFSDASELGQQLGQISVRDEVVGHCRADHHDPGALRLQTVQASLHLLHQFGRHLVHRRGVEEQQSHSRMRSRDSDLRHWGSVHGDREIYGIPLGDVAGG